MKKIIYNIVIVLSACLFSACESDLEKITYSPANGTAPVLSGVEESYILDVENALDTIMRLAWTEADMGVKSEFIYNVEIDFAANNFKNKVVLAATDIETPYQALRVNELNNSIVKLMGDSMEFKEYEFEIRVSAFIATTATPLYSNVQKSAITPYYSEPEYPKIALRGWYNEWGFSDAQYLYSPAEDNNYSGWIVFNTGQSERGWKLCEDEEWLIQWGSGNASPEAETLALEPRTTDNPDPAAITSYSKYGYKFSFDKSTAKFKVEQSVDSWGIHIVGQTGNDIKFNLLSKETTGGKTNWYLRGDLTVTEDVEILFRPDNKESIYFGLGNKGRLTEMGTPIPVEAGRYRIKFYFNKVEPYYELMLR